MRKNELIKRLFRGTFSSEQLRNLMRFGTVYVLVSTKIYLKANLSLYLWVIQIYLAIFINMISTICQQVKKHSS